MNNYKRQSNEKTETKILKAKASDLQNIKF